jgi:hypothetical protein
MFGNEMPDTLPASYGNDMQVESFVQTPGERRALRKFVRSADGPILPQGPTGLDAEVEWIPQADDFVSLPQENPGSPWAPQPPYVGAEMAQLVSDTPYRRGRGVPITRIAPQSTVQQEYKKMYNGSHYSGHDPTHFGAVPDAPLTSGNKDGWFSSPVTNLRDSLIAAGAQVPPGAAEGGVYDSSMVMGVKSFQGQWNKGPEVAANAALKLQESGVFDKATEMALRKKLGEDVQAQSGGGLTGDDWIGIGGLGVEVLKIFKGQDEEALPPATLPPVAPQKGSATPWIVGSIVLIGVVVVVAALNKDDD